MEEQVITITKAIPRRWVYDSLRYDVVFDENGKEYEGWVDWIFGDKKYKGEYRGEMRAPIILGAYLAKEEAGCIILKECETRKVVGTCLPIYQKRPVRRDE